MMVSYFVCCPYIFKKIVAWECGAPSDFSDLCAIVQLNWNSGTGLLTLFFQCLMGDHILHSVGI